jgi:hypothetical protein
VGATQAGPQPGVRGGRRRRHGPALNRIQRDGASG